jgi:hypothetical protein
MTTLMNSHSSAVEEEVNSVRSTPQSGFGIEFCETAETMSHQSCLGAALHTIFKTQIEL